jgi:hypothetical protein
LASPVAKRLNARWRRRRRKARIANEQASEAASQVAAAVAVAAEADARADVAEAEVETLKAKLELADAERAERSAGSKNKAFARETSERARPRLFVEEEEDDDDDDEREEETSFSRRLRALQLARVKDQHVAALRVGELEEELERARTAAAVFEARLRDAECEKESADERTAVAFEAVDRLRRENDALRHEKASATGGADAGRKENQPGGERGRLDDDAAGAAAPRAFAAELSALRAVATGLARDICEAAEFGLAASAVDVPKAPPGAPDGEEAPAAGEAKYWYDAARNEIRLL